jgi:AcrR family transcriptional regulator
MEVLSRKERERKVRENEIIQAAEKILKTKGYNDTSMDEIAKEAQFTKRTLYQYFQNKEDLYFTVVLNEYEKLFGYLKSGLENGDTGFMKIYLSCLEYYNFYLNYPDTLSLINYIGYVKNKSQAVSKKRDDMLKFDNFIFKEVAKVIEEGKNDGSIKASLNSDMTAYSLIFMITGFFNQISVTGHTFTEHFKLEFEEFIMYSLNLLLKSIDNTKEAQR